MSVTSDSVQPVNLDVLAGSSEPVAPPAEQPAALRPHERAARRLALAERSVRWEDDVTPAELELYESLYLDVLRQADVELHADISQAPHLASPGRSRTALLQLRGEACAAVLRAEQRRRAASRRPASSTRRLILALAALLLSLGVVLFMSREWLADIFDSGNLSRGKPWLASSRHANDVPLSGVLGSFSAPFFFHTGYEDRPWIEVDLGTETAVRSVTIINRQDCCANRAVPLVVETSSDHRAWRIAATQRRTFSRWRAPLDTPPARWLRFRVLRVSNLHFKALVVRK